MKVSENLYVFIHLFYLIVYCLIRIWYLIISMKITWNFVLLNLISESCEA